MPLSTGPNITGPTLEHSIYQGCGKVFTTGQAPEQSQADTNSAKKISLLGKCCDELMDENSEKVCYCLHNL